MHPGRVYSLSLHASYACGKSGACCTAGWPIPVEARLRRLLGGTVLMPNADGGCRYFDRASGLCAVHRDHGPDLLPAACFQFPRRALIDDRGIFVTLSHYCPTAARLLFQDRIPLEIVDSPPAFPAGRVYEGLDARGTWPPLVRRDLLFDLESYTRWERFIVRTLGEPSLGVGESLARISIAAEDLRSWTSAKGSFDAWTTAVLHRRESSGRFDHSMQSAAECYASYSEMESFHEVTGTVPAGLQAPRLPENAAGEAAQIVDLSWQQFTGPIRRFLASKAFGSWSAYQSRGVRTLVAELYASEMVLRVEAIRACTGGDPLDEARLLAAVRAADLLLVHLADRERFVTWLGQAEQ